MLLASCSELYKGDMKMNSARWAEKLDLVLEVYSKSRFLKNWSNPYKVGSYYYTPSHLFTKEAGPDSNGNVLKKFLFWMLLKNFHSFGLALSVHTLA